MLSATPCQAALESVIALMARNTELRMVLEEIDLPDPVHIPWINAQLKHQYADLAQLAQFLRNDGEPT